MLLQPFLHQNLITTPRPEKVCGRGGTASTTSALDTGELAKLYCSICICLYTNIPINTGEKGFV